MPHGVTNFGSPVKYSATVTAASDGSGVGEKAINFETIAKLGNGACAIATGEGSSGSGLGGLIPASADELDTLFRVPGDFKADAASYIDVYFWVTGAATSTDGVTLVGTYESAGTGSGTAISDATTTTGVTDPGTKNPTLNGVTKATHTIAASTFSAGELVHWQTTVKTTCTEKELRVVPEAVFRYTKQYM